MAKLVVDLHDCFNNDTKIESALNNAIEDAVSSRIRLVEIIPGKGERSAEKTGAAFSGTETHQVAVSPD